MFKKVLYNTGAQTLGKIVSSLSTLLITLLIGKSLGPSGFGEFTKIFVFIGYFYTLADFGLNSIFIKLAQEKNNANLFKSLIALRLLFATLLAATAIIISFFLPYDLDSATGFSPLVKTGIVIAALTIITQALFTTSSAFFQLKLRFDLGAVATLLTSVVMVACTFALSLKSGQILPYIAVYVVGGIIYVASAYFLIWHKFKQSLYPLFEFSKIKTMLSLSWPLGAALILNLLYFRIDVFILANTRGSAEVGLYGLAYQFFQAALAVPIFFANVLYPILSKQFLTEISQFKKTAKTWGIYLFVISLIMTAFLIVISYFIPALYDIRFTPSAQALRILSIGMPAFFVSALIWHLLIIYSKQRLLIYIYAAGAVFNLVLNLIFIPRYGFLAAAATTVISEIFILALLFAALKESSLTSKK